MAFTSHTPKNSTILANVQRSQIAGLSPTTDLGMEFMICEKMKSIQRTRHWFGAINTRYTKDAGLEVDEGRLLNEWARYASGQCDQRVIRVWIRESSDMVEWIDPILTAAGMTCEFDADIDHETGGTGYYVAPMQHYYAGKDANGDRLERNKVLLAYINEKGYDVTYEHSLVKLIQNESGRVTGAIFKTGSTYVQVNAKKGVLLATGGYAGNAEMLRACNLMVDRCVTLQVGSPNDVGDGIKAGMWIGGQKDTIGVPMIFDRGAVLPGQDAGIVSEAGASAEFIGTDKQFNLGSQPLMKVARDGRRFCNESTPYDSCCFAAAEHEGGVFCQIFDSNLKEDVKRFSTIGCSRQTQILLASNEDKPLDEIYADQLEKGTMVKADTIDELADKLGFTGEAKEAFLAEVDTYNGFYDAQLRQGSLPPLRAAHGSLLRHLVRRCVADYRRRPAHQRGHAGARCQSEADRGSLCRRRLLRQHVGQQLPRIHRRQRMRTYAHLRAPRRPPYRRRYRIATDHASRTRGRADPSHARPRRSNPLGTFLDRRSSPSTKRDAAGSLMSPSSCRSNLM